MALLVRRWRGEQHDAHVACVERRDEAADRPSLAGGIPAFNANQEPRPNLPVAKLSAECQPQLIYPLAAVGKLLVSSAPARKETKRAILAHYANSRLFELSLKDAKAAFAEFYSREMLRRAGGSLPKAAGLAGVTRQTL